MAYLIRWPLYWTIFGHQRTEAQRRGWKHGIAYIYEVPIRYQELFQALCSVNTCTAYRSQAGKVL